MMIRVRDALDRYVYPVHRLDRPTSGCLLFALSSEAVPPLQDALREGEKTYVALVRGVADRFDGVTIDRPLAKEGVDQEAQTAIEVLASAPEPRCSLVLARPATGRFHQVRRHLAGVGHPILGDSTHGDTRVNRAWRERGLERLALHCYHLRLALQDGPLDVTAPIPPDLGAVIDGLPFAGVAHERLAFRAAG